MTLVGGNYDIGRTSLTFAYTQNTLRVYAKVFAPIRKKSSPVRKNKPIELAACLATYVLACLMVLSFVQFVCCSV